MGAVLLSDQSCLIRIHFCTEHPPLDAMTCHDFALHVNRKTLFIDQHHSTLEMSRASNNNQYTQ